MRRRACFKVGAGFGAAAVLAPLSPAQAQELAWIRQSAMTVRNSLAGLAICVRAISGAE